MVLVVAGRLTIDRHSGCQTSKDLVRGVRYSLVAKLCAVKDLCRLV